MEEREFTMDEIRNIEETGRSLARELVDNRFSDKLSDKIIRWRNDVCDVNESIMGKIWAKGNYSERGKYGEFVHALDLLVYAASDASNWCNKHTTRGVVVDDKCIMASEWIDDLIGNMNNASNALLGTSCAHGKITENYSVGGGIHDVSSCYNKLIDKFDEYSDELSKLERDGKCIIEKGIDKDKDMIEACDKWDETTDKFNKSNIYRFKNYIVLHANLFGGKGEFRLGDDPNHISHFDLDKGTVDYYNNNKIVNETMCKLFDNVGLKCKIKDDGVSCTGLDRKNVRDASKRLAGATEMGYRLSRIDLCGYLSTDSYAKRYEKFWGAALSKIHGMGKRCKIDTVESDQVGVETCLIEEHLRANEDIWRG